MSKKNTDHRRFLDCTCSSPRRTSPCPVFFFDSQYDGSNDVIEGPMSCLEALCLDP